MFNNKEILQIALEQSAADVGCHPDDFLKTIPVVFEGHVGDGARIYLKEPMSCHLVSYGNNVVAMAKPALLPILKEYTERYTFYHLFETPNALWLNEQLATYGHKLCYMADYFLPDLDKLAPLSCPYELKVLYPADFAELYTSEWSNAIMVDRKELDRLAIGAYDGDKLVGLAGCSEDCATMWQIGVDVLPEYRKQGVAAAITSHLAWEILAREKVPFYCCAWSNVASAKNAIKSGFRPAWVELTVKPADFVDRINNKN